MRYDPARQEVTLKVVYYGPGLAGKTTNLQVLQQRVPAGQASELISVDTHSERTLQFDYLALELGRIQGLAVRLEFFTVPGQSYYAATRRQVLEGADGVVFVADTRREALDENIDAMNEMLNNLRHHGLPSDLPVVLQYNKQDLPTAVPPEQLQPLLNGRGWPSFPAVAITGEGVADTCDALVRMLADRLANTEIPRPTPGSNYAAVRTPAPEAPKSWLITCYRCQSMLDVPSAAPGEGYTCGVCHAQLEVVDADRGLTRAQQPSSTSAAVEPDTYAAGDLGSGGYQTTSALKPQTGSLRRPGQVAGDYPLDGFEILSLLDDNPQGRRLRVREQASGKTFRSLVLSPALLAQPGYRDALEPYARMAGPVRHPNLLQLNALRPVADQMVYLAADPQDYEPLSHVLARRRALAPPHAIGIIRQLTLALEEGARAGAVHGWLRPDVVLVGQDGNVLLDELYVPASLRFLSRELQGVSAATEYYLAPEYLNEDLRGDIRSDIFLLGALLFRMITGDGLVTGYNALEALHKIAANGPRLLRDVQQGISRELNGFYLRLVAVDRSERFQTYREVIDALDRFGGGAKRQALQLTSTQLRPPGIPRPGPGMGTQTGRRGSTGPLPPAPTRRAGRQDDSSGHRRVAAPTPPARRKSSATGPIAVAVVLIVAMVAALAAVLMLRPRPVAVSDQPTEVPAMPPANRVVSTSPVATAVRPAVTTTTTPVANPAQPTNQQPNGGLSPAADPAKVRMELKRTLADQIVSEQFASALKTCQQFAEPLDQRESQAQVLDHHDLRKKDIEALLKPGLDPEQVRKALQPARTLWGMPGDLEWVVAVQSKADAIALAQNVPVPPVPAPTTPTVAEVSTTTPAVVPAPAPDKVATEWGPTKPAPLVDPRHPAPAAADAAPVPREVPPLNDATSAAYGTVVRALIANQPAQAQAAFASLPAGSPAAVALRQLCDWWPNRSGLLNRVAAAKSVKLRLSHPTTGEVVDLSAADATGVTVTSPNGSSSGLSWSQLPPRIQAKLFADAVTPPGATAEEFGGAVASQLIADETAMAEVIAKRGKAQLAERAAQVEVLVELAERRNAVAVLNKGFDAARAGNLSAANDALTEARKLDKSWLKGLDAEVARLDTAINAPVAAPVASTTTPATAPTAGETMGKTAPRDLAQRQTALRTLGWEPLGEAWLDGTSVQMMANSGIAFTLGKGVVGFSLQASGDGYLRLVPARGTATVAAKGGVALPLAADRISNFTVSFTRDAMAVLDGQGRVIQSYALQAPPTLFLVISTGDAILQNVPKPNLQ
jgi:hypothetical protein